MAECKDIDTSKLDYSSESEFLNEWDVFTKGDIKECQFANCKEKDKAFQRSESSSSSDVDVIEEDNPEKLEETRLSSETSTALPAPYITFSSAEDILPEEMSCSNDNMEDFATDHSEYDDDELETYGVDVTCLITIGKVILAITLANLLYNIGWGYLDNKRTIKEMKHIIEDLNLENSNLRNQLISEDHKEAAFSAFEIQIKELENKNMKLNEKLQDALSEVQKQSFSHYSESKMLHNEINQLKEQINIMQFDNEELQKQLVHLRYKGFPSQTHLDHDVDSGDQDSTSNVHFSTSDGNANFERENDGDNSTETLAEDLKKLHQELISEIGKIKKWNEIVEVLAKKLRNSDSEDKKWTLRDMKQNFNDIVLEAQKNIAETIISFQNLNISDMFTKYMKYNEETVENVFGSIGQYFKAAQEKTQKLFKKHAPTVDKATINNVWNAADNLKEKWSYMKDEFFKMADILDTDGRKKSVNNPTILKNKANLQDHTQKAETFHQKRTVFSEKSTKNTFDKQAMENHNRDSYFGNDHKSHYDKDDSITWIFRRAADRAKLRKDDN